MIIWLSFERSSSRFTSPPTRRAPTDVSLIRKRKIKLNRVPFLQLGLCPGAVFITGQIPAGSKSGLAQNMSINVHFDFLVLFLKTILRSFDVVLRLVFLCVERGTVLISAFEFQSWVCAWCMRGNVPSPWAASLSPRLGVPFVR